MWTLQICGIQMDVLGVGIRTLNFSYDINNVLIYFMYSVFSKTRLKSVL